MTIFERARNLFRRRVEYTGAPGYWERQMPNFAGKHRVSERDALAIGAVYACVSKIAGTIASLPFNVYRVTGDRREMDPAHPAFQLIADTPQPQLTPFAFLETIVAHTLIYGKGYAIIQRDRGAAPVSLSIVHPDDVEAYTDENGLHFTVREFGFVDAADMFCLSCMHGLSPIRLHADSLGTLRNAEDFAGDFFANGGQMTGILTSDTPIRAEQAQEIVKQWHGGAQGGTKILPFGLNYQRISLRPDEAQYIESRKFGVIEVARIFNVPPIMIQAEEAASYQGSAAYDLFFAKHTIAPWVARLEQEIRAKLFTSADRATHICSFDMRGLMRGDLAARSAYYSQMLSAGVLTIDEVRREENRDPVPNGIGRHHLVQVNQLTLDHIDEFSRNLSGGDELPDEG